MPRRAIPSMYLHSADITPHCTQCRYRNLMVASKIDATVKCVEIYQNLEIGFNVVVNRIKRHFPVKK